MAAIIMSVAKKHGRRNSDHHHGGGRNTEHHHGSFKSEDYHHALAAVNKDPTGAEKGLERLQRILREKVIYKHKRLHRANLAERLTFESETALGLLRFTNQLMVFALFLAALSFSSNQEVTRGIMRTLEAEFDFEGIKDVSRRDQFVRESMTGISDKSKEFFILSNKYFDDQGLGSAQLIRDVTSFTDPQLSSPVDLHVLAFSFTAWVKVVPQFVEGYIVRKRLVSDGDGSSLACWGWFLSATNGQELHYGCHDFFALSSDDRQVEVGLGGVGGVEAEEWSLLTVVVEGREARFYRNVELLGAAGLPRPVTDCFNDGEGLLVGAGGLSLALVRFHPRALAVSAIEELFTGGSLLADISTGSTPLDAEPEGLRSTERALLASIDGVQDSVAGRQAESEITAVLNFVAAEQSNPAPADPGTPAPPSEAPLGQSSAPSTSQSDPVTARPYFLLARGPWRLSPTSNAADHRSIVNLPDARGRGFSFTWWYRHVPCDKSTCGLFLFSVRDDERICYAVWLETVALWFENALGDPAFQYPANFVESKFQLNDDRNWRHLALVWDETDDMVYFYMDGKFAVRGPWGSAVAGADCTAGGKFMTFGRYGPFDYTYGGDVDMFDFRQYVHGAEGPLTPAEILAIASAETPELNPAQRCLSIESPLMADTPWTDTFGHACEWFIANKEAYPALCDYADAQRECPVACASRQECLTLEPDPDVFLTWDRIRRVEATGPNGTLCLASHLSPDQVVADCEAWAAQHSDLSQAAPDLEAWLDSVLNLRRGRRVNVTSCQELRESIDPLCAFDSLAVRNFTAAAQANGGDWTIAFWIRPTGAQSKIRELGHFYPHVQHNLAVGLWANPFGEARVFSACDRAQRDIFDNIETSAADDDGWTLVTISRRNAREGLDGDATVVTNIARNWEGSQLEQCLYDPEMFMNAIEINYPALVSPIMMIPKALPLAQIQQRYFQSADAIRLRTGPIVTNRARVLDTGIAIDKQDYSPRSILMAPPIIFQTRTEPAEQCPFGYSSGLIEEEHAKMGSLKCSTPFQCPDEVIEDKFLLYACPGPRITAPEQRTFGLEPKSFNGLQGFADFLATIVDHPLVWRDGELRFTENFIDSRTELAQVILVFFTPDAGTTSVLTVQADFAGFSAAEVSVELSHYEILEGTSKWVYLAMQVLVMVNITLMAVDIFVNFKGMVKDFRDTHEYPSATAVIKQLVDFGTIGMVVAFITLRIPQKFDTAPATERIVGGMSHIPWDSVEVPLEEKKETFFALTTELLSAIAYEQSLNKFCNVILLVSLLRVVQCTSLHPRLALLTGTIAKSFDDMWHSCLLVVLLMGCFAGVATWRFGSTRDDFGNFEQAMQTQFEMLFGEFPDDWTETRDMQAYTVLYIMIMFLLIQNFLLAIIVEAYMKVREHNEKMCTHQEITLDVMGCFNAYLAAKIHGWPSPGFMGRVISDWEAKFSVGFKEIYATGLFRSQHSAASWTSFYAGYDFLEPEEVGRFGLERESDSLEDKVESRVARVVGKEKPLKEFADDTIRESRLGSRLGLASHGHGNGNGNGNGISKGQSNGKGIGFGTGGGPPRHAQVQALGGQSTHRSITRSIPAIIPREPSTHRGEGGAVSADFVHREVSSPQTPEQSAEQRSIAKLEHQVGSIQMQNAELLRMVSALAQQQQQQQQQQEPGQPQQASEPSNYPPPPNYLSEYPRRLSTDNLSLDNSIASAQAFLPSLVSRFRL